MEEKAENAGIRDSAIFPTKAPKAPRFDSIWGKHHLGKGGKTGGLHEHQIGENLFDILHPNELVTHQPSCSSGFDILGKVIDVKNLSRRERDLVDDPRENLRLGFKCLEPVRKKM